MEYWQCPERSLEPPDEYECRPVEIEIECGECAEVFELELTPDYGETSRDGTEWHFADNILNGEECPNCHSHKIAFN